MRIIALMPVRNEAWILERSLRTLDTFCDKIIVADQQSSDGTREILQKIATDKVTIIDNDNKTWNERIRWKLLDTAREYDGNNFILITDADEVISANIMQDNILDHFISFKPGTSITVELVNIWRNPFFWRNDRSIWTGRWLEMGFRDDRNVRYVSENITEIHESRVPKATLRKNKKIKNFKLLHYQFVLYDRMLSKQRRYRALEAIKLGTIEAEKINQYYCITRDERHIHLEPIKSEWTAGWKERGIDLENFSDEQLYWYDVEVLRHFKEKGAAYFAPIDLWEVDWEEKRLLAKAQGYEGIPDEPISDPRTREQRLYHAYLHRFFRTPPWRDAADLARMPGRWLRAGVRATGLRRRHLERLGVLSPVNLEDPERP
jgi:glycosyltransferase involved in cell wall biosynthesis